MENKKESPEKKYREINVWRKVERRNSHKNSQANPLYDLFNVIFLMVWANGMTMVEPKKNLLFFFVVPQNKMLILTLDSIWNMLTEILTSEYIT